MRGPRSLIFFLRWAMRVGVVMAWVALFQRDVPACLLWILLAFSSAMAEMEFL